MTLGKESCWRDCGWREALGMEKCCENWTIYVGIKDIWKSQLEELGSKMKMKSNMRLRNNLELIPASGVSGFMCLHGVFIHYWSLCKFDFFGLLFHVYTWMVCIWGEVMNAPMCKYMQWEGQWLMSWVFLKASLTLFFSQHVSLKAWLSNMGGLARHLPRSFYFFLFKLELLGTCHIPGLYMESGDLNSCSLAYGEVL